MLNYLYTHSRYCKWTVCPSPSLVSFVWDEAGCKANSEPVKFTINKRLDFCQIWLGEYKRPVRLSYVLIDSWTDKWVDKPCIVMITLVTMQWDIRKHVRRHFPTKLCKLVATWQNFATLGINYIQGYNLTKYWPYKIYLKIMIWFTLLYFLKPRLCKKPKTDAGNPKNI